MVQSSECTARIVIARQVFVHSSIHLRNCHTHNVLFSLFLTHSPQRTAHKQKNEKGEGQRWSKRVLTIKVRHASLPLCTLHSFLKVLIQDFSWVPARKHRGVKA